MIEKGIRGRMCHVIHSSAKANNKYMKDNDPGTESSIAHVIGYQLSVSGMS